MTHLILIASLITHSGKLYQRLENGSIGAVIDKLYSAYLKSMPTYQFASKVLNISSFWSSSDDYSPKQALGPQDCFTYGDCSKSW